MITSIVFVLAFLGIVLLVGAKIVEMRLHKTPFSSVREKGDRFVLRFFCVSAMLIQKGRARMATTGPAEKTLHVCREAYAYGAWMLRSRPIRMARSMPERGLHPTKQKVSHYLQEVSKTKEQRLSGRERERIDS